ncbi:hypothetical protein RJ639_017968 [Escallonia herrerae]|uniref:DUF659 domain-containing protein n=1 Tax=Escallonia herrerae TaxID=1293975 RepID=A0AA88V6T6_9ASTE|nr:hypothetical protein RJ639_017968 [Escallonia herrerae]
MSDGWSNCGQEPVINFLVYYPKGPTYILQFLTDYETTYKAVGKWLQREYGFFWAPCAAHCICLMLENLYVVDATIIKAKNITKFM